MTISTTLGNDRKVDHKIGTREDWLAARLDLLTAEKDYAREGDELARRRQELPWVRIDKDYRFDTDEGVAVCRCRSFSTESALRDMLHRSGISVANGA